MLKKAILNFLVVIILTFTTFTWTFFIFHLSFDVSLILFVLTLRILSSILIFKDYSLSWSKATQKTFLLKSIVYISPFLFYSFYYYGEYRLSFLVSELFLYLFSINFLMYSYHYFMNRSTTQKTKTVVIYGAGKAGIKLETEFVNTEYKVKYFCDDSQILQDRSIDNVKILSINSLKQRLGKNKFNLLVIAMPSAKILAINKVYNALYKYFDKIQFLPSIENILQNTSFATQLKEISVEDLLARHPADLDKFKISTFLNSKTILITGAGGSIGSEITRQCIRFKAKNIIMLDHSEFNLYKIDQELNHHKNINIVPIMQSVVDMAALEKTFNKYKIDIVIHAAAYKHVPLVELNIEEAINNNIIGTKNIIDISIKNKVNKLVLISTDKAVRPTNVMGSTKRICELYAQNSNGFGTDIVGVRFGNVLGSSGSVIPKFKEQIKQGKNITVTHPDITRYFMLIPEACELVLQAGAIGTGGEIFILNMGEPIKIVDLAKKMIKLSGRNDIKIEFSGLRIGEKLYEELLIDDSNCTTDYKSITVAKPTSYNLAKLNKDINELIKCDDKIKQLKIIVPEFEHKLNKQISKQVKKLDKIPQH